MRVTTTVTGVLLMVAVSASSQVCELEPLDAVSTPGSAERSVIVGDIAYVADGPQGLRVIDVSRPGSPRVAAHLNTPGEAVGITLAGDHAYLADGPAGLRVLDISDPAAPTEVAAFDASGYVSDVLIQGGLAYLAAGASGLRIIDFHDSNESMSQRSRTYCSSTRPSLTMTCASALMTGTFVPGDSGRW